jgi:hypothetical protein
MRSDAFRCARQFILGVLPLPVRVAINVHTIILQHGTVHQEAQGIVPLLFLLPAVRFGLWLLLGLCAH